MKNDFKLINPFTEVTEEDAQKIEHNPNNENFQMGECSYAENIVFFKNEKDDNELHTCFNLTNIENEKKSFDKLNTEIWNKKEFNNLVRSVTISSFNNINTNNDISNFYNGNYRLNNQSCSLLKKKSK